MGHNNGLFMVKKLTPQQIDLIQPTVGWEGELLPVRFVLMEGNEISFAKRGEVLLVFESASKKIRCDQDNLTHKEFASQLIQIAERRKLSIKKDSPIRSHVFEFVTLPSKNIEEISEQFEEIKRIETDLVKYVANFSIRNPAEKFVCVQEWIDDYNLRFPENKLIGSVDTKKMFIVVNYSIKQLDASLKYNVQFNFVVNFSKKMGNKLIDVID